MWFIYVVLSINVLLCLAAISNVSSSGLKAAIMIGALSNLIGLVIAAADITLWVSRPTMGIMAFIMFCTVVSNDSDVTGQIRNISIILTVLNILALILSFV